MSHFLVEEQLGAHVSTQGGVQSAPGRGVAIGATALQTQSGIAPNDLKAIQSAAEEVASIDRRQADRIKAVQARLAH